MTTGMAHIGEDLQRFSRGMRQFLALTKPRVVSLIVFTAVIGMFLTPGMVTLPQAVFDDVCIALMGGAAAATNWLLDPECKDLS